MKTQEPVRTFRCDEDLWKRVKAKAKLWSLSVTDIIRLSLKHYLGDLNINEVLDNKEAAKQIPHVPDDDDNE